MTNFSLKTPPKTLQNIDRNLLDNDTGIEVQNVAHRISKVKFTGGGYGLKIHSGASDIGVTDFVSLDPAEYGVYIGQGSGTKPNHGIKFTNLRVDLLTKGEHCIRIYATKDLTINGAKLTHKAPYGGATLNVKQVTMMRGSKIDLTGQPPGFGPNEKNLGEDAYCVEDVVIDGGIWGVTSQIVFWPNTRKLTLKNLTINVEKNEVFTVRPALRTRKEPREITIDNCKITGSGKLFTGNGGAIKFCNSTFNSKLIP